MLSALQQHVVDLVLKKGYERRDEPFRLSSGEQSHDYIDGKRALAKGSDLELAARAVLEVAENLSVTFTCVGGLTMGADPLAHAVALLSDTSWFAVRKDSKEHGKQRLVEGASLSGATVLLLDDVVTTGGSIMKALEAIDAEGAAAVLAVCLVDRSGVAGSKLAERGVPFHPLCTWQDLGIEPVRDGRVIA